MEYTALYRRFRPKTFSEIVGQEHITQTLKNQVKANRVGHAYLFTGSRGCGKTTSAKVLARAINCLHPKDGEPCNECEICKAALDGSLTDIVEMDAASNNGVDDIRAIKDEVNFLPTIAKYRVYIIDEVHMLSQGAFNALLKTLEEPPAHVKFILATTEPQKLPATILSRCQRFDFKKIAPEKIVKNLEKICKECNIDYTLGALNLIAELSEGAMRDAISILERCVQEGDSKITDERIKELVGIPETQYIIDSIDSIITHNEQKALQITQNVIKEGKDVSNFTWELIKFVRNMMLLKATNEISNIYNDDEVTKMKEMNKLVTEDELLNIISNLSSLQNEIGYTTQKNIVFQVGILKLLREDNSSLEDRVKKLEEIIKNGDVRITNNKNIGKNQVEKGNQIQNQNGENIFSNSEISNANNIEQAKNNINSQSIVKKIPFDREQGNAIGKLPNNANGVPILENVKEKLKDEGKTALYAALLKAKGKEIDDMTYGIGNINSFSKAIIESPDNMSELKRLISMECNKDMRIKLVYGNNNNVSQSNNKPLDIGIDINYIE